MTHGERKPGVHLYLVTKPTSTCQPGDEALVRAFLAGEPHAAEQIWDKYSGLVDRSLRRLLGPTADVEDLTQEVFLRVFERLPTLIEASALRSFIYSIAVRIVRWELRRRWVRRCLTLSPTGQLPDAAGRPCDFEARQAVVRFYEVLDKLATLDRAAFVLYHFEGFNLEEAARSLGVSLATVKRRIHRATERINDAVRNDTSLTGYVGSSERAAGPQRLEEQIDG